ncbi:MAG: hypothetical protein HYV27_24555 [Candidatus Hydrogenedentes bacterium]|nr:hypothetical protein [Candidatus Hydrogenedentota bacterium]
MPMRFAGYRGTCKLCGGVIVPRDPVQAPPPEQPAPPQAPPPKPQPQATPPLAAAPANPAISIDAPLPYRPELENDEAAIARVRREALIVSHNNMEPIMLHQAYAILIKHYWDYLHNGYDCLELLIQACAQQTEISSRVMESIRASSIDTLPVHRGFLYLARVRLRQGLYQKSVQLCVRAQDEGWPGKWKDIIQLCEERLDSRDYQQRMAFIMGNSGPGSNP